MPPLAICANPYRITSGPAACAYGGTMKFGWCVLGLLICFSAPPSFAQEREWTFDTGDEEAFLVFGVPESDDVGISFWCKIKSGEIHIFLAEAGEHLPAKKKSRLRILVGGKSYAFSGTVSRNEETGTMSLEAAVKAGSPVFDALRKAESFTVKVYRGDESAFPLPGADVDSLQRACA
ncbi:hypothetical protein BH10PSE7_BH10PSE7_40640 [soil metagenome]